MPAWWPRQDLCTGPTDILMVGVSHGALYDLGENFWPLTIPILLSGCQKN
jgi:hypothetical protein